MRNPRITGFNKKIYKITIEGGHIIRVTGNHKFLLKDGIYKEAKELKNGDSLSTLTKWESSFDEIFPESNSKSSDYLWINNGKIKSNISEHRFIYEQSNNIKIEKGSVIHHKDYNSLNNNLNNLQLMKKNEHDEFHKMDMMGDKNPYHKMSDEWKFNFASHKGTTNRSYIEISTDELKEYALVLTKKLNRRFSKKDWIKYAKENKIPQTFSQFRLNEVESGITSMSKWAALKLNIEFIDSDPRLVKSYMKMLENGYNAKIENNKVFVEKICETCNNPYWVKHSKREISFCSHICSLKYVNKNKDIKTIRNNSINKIYSEKSEHNIQKQVKILSDLTFNLGRIPKLKEWEIECKKENVPHRLKTKHGFNSFKDIKKEAALYNHKVISVELDGYEDVYNGTVDDVHNFYAGGFEEVTKSGKRKWLSINQLQCGEIPLCPYDSCRLLAINLYSYVINPFEDDAYFDFELFSEHAQYAQRFMDDIVDLEIEKVDKILEKIKSDPEVEEIKRVEIKLWEKIKEKSHQGRRTGLGITAEGDMLAALGYKYGTKKATDFSVKVHKTLAVNAYKSSITMANERGAFDVWDFDQEFDNPFMQRVWKELPKEYQDMYRETGRRNIALLTIAPTGSVSIMTQTTSGIEPVFLPVYTRRRKINPNDKSTKVDFVDENGDSWEEYNVFHPKFKVWTEKKGYNTVELEKMKSTELQPIIEASPYFGATSNDVDWLEKVEMQGKIQKWVDHSISVTVNLPKEVDEELVGKVYEVGWKSGCKGITVYRDGSRSGVLVSKVEKKPNVFQENNAPSRPKTLQCDVIRFTNKGEKWIGFLGLMDNRPYEIFTGLQESVNIPTYIEVGELIKRKNAEADGHSRYDLKYVDKDGYTQEFRGLSRAFNREFWNTGRLVSGILRHGMPLPNVMALLDKLDFGDSEIIASWRNGVKRMIKKYIKDGTKISGEECPECHSHNIVYKEGCKTCLDCNWSKCD